MKKIMKKIVAILLILILFVIVLVSCTALKHKTNTEAETNEIIVPTKINDCLFYDTNTKIVYIIWHDGFLYRGFGYMSPYIAPNGYPYTYNEINNTLIEKNE